MAYSRHCKPCHGPKEAPWAVPQMCMTDVFGLTVEKAMGHVGSSGTFPPILEIDKLGLI